MDCLGTRARLPHPRPLSRGAEEGNGRGALCCTTGPRRSGRTRPRDNAVDLVFRLPCSLFPPSLQFTQRTTSPAPPLP